MADHYGPAVATIRRLMPARLKSRYDAEDFVAAAIVDLVRRPDGYSGVNSLILIAKRRMIDAIRAPDTQRHGGNLGSWV